MTIFSSPAGFRGDRAWSGGGGRPAADESLAGGGSRGWRWGQDLSKKARR